MMTIEALTVPIGISPDASDQQPEDEVIDAGQGKSMETMIMLYCDVIKEEFMAKNKN